MAEVTVEELAANVSQLMQERLGVRSGPLSQQLRRAGRRLPKRVRRDISSIADALPLAANPKLSRQINLPRLEAAERRAVAHLRTIDRAMDRLQMALTIGTGIGLSLFFAAGFAALLVWYQSTL
ncbi:hypothetical protein ACMU_10320 [Actibacterium mucosum KCTC 23349]|uniref:Uncharacterized protein n=1 Tax=Actibacterium mucosum KCTC 23349 TaxID=1454373 RepID=A0A037ZMS9_9RHOB|nr:hypothetical protein [Actibacterium mucosum]KAJ56141.1 hypothetical protein ACMU_10320 [Actibacterium mucosum KCTC 23349]